MLYKKHLSIGEKLFKDKKSALIREDELMLELKSNLNEKKAYLSLEGKKDYKRSKNICDCGGKFNNSDKAHHFKTNKHKEYELHKNSVYIGVKENCDIIAILKYERFTELALNIHIYTHTWLQHKGTMVGIRKTILDYCETQPVNKLIIMAPEPCTQVIKAALRYGFKNEGQLTKVTMWRNQIVDLILFGYNLREAENG
jgi:L-amino acid N-acyltransferase YncA